MVLILSLLCFSTRHTYHFSRRIHSDLFFIVWLVHYYYFFFFGQVCVCVCVVYTLCISFALDILWRVSSAHEIWSANKEQHNNSWNRRKWKEAAAKQRVWRKVLHCIAISSRALLFMMCLWAAFHPFRWKKSIFCLAKVLKLESIYADLSVDACNAAWTMTLLFDHLHACLLPFLTRTRNTQHSLWNCRCRAHNFAKFEHKHQALASR